MAFIDDIRKLAGDALKWKDEVKNEEETKKYLIEPFINILGYKDLPDLRLEYTADVGEKQDAKVDYAIFKDGSLTILFECKHAGVDLNRNRSPWNQLFGYYSNVSARFGVLTNGLVYQFYTDLEKLNLLDSLPFLEFDLSDIQEPLVEELEKFTKANFDADNILSTARELKYIGAIKHILATEYESPSEEFVTFCRKKVFGKEEADQSVIEEFTGYTKRAFHQFVTERTKERQSPGDENEVAHIPETDSAVEEQGWQPLSELNPQSSGPNPKPTEISFPNNTTVPITAWTHIMVEAVGWLIEKGHLNKNHCPITSRRGKYLVEHLDDKNLRTPKQIGTFYFETPNNARNTVSQVRRIIQHVGQDPAQFKVRFP